MHFNVGLLMPTALPMMSSGVVGADCRAQSGDHLWNSFRYHPGALGVHQAPELASFYGKAWQHPPL